MKRIVTIVGIRPDFIRMSEVFKQLDKHFEHTMIHTGQHFEYLLSDVFFESMNIRKPDYNLGLGAPGKEHYHQTGDYAVGIIDLLREKDIKPDLILFLGDANTTSIALILKREGYRIGHIEAGMRSGDEWMYEEINRKSCDHVSTYNFAYHEDNKENMIKENIPEKNIFVVGNTIVEIAKPYIEKFSNVTKRNDFILMDIHRGSVSEVIQNKKKFENVIRYANLCIEKYELPVKMLRFGRTFRYLEEYGLDLGKIEPIDLMSYNDFMEKQYHALFIISDSGTAHEEPALLGTPVIAPRDYTERPQSIKYNCSFMLSVNQIGGKYNYMTEKDNWATSHDYLEKVFNGDLWMDTMWLGDGKTAERVANILRKVD